MDNLILSDIPGFELIKPIPASVDEDGVFEIPELGLFALSDDWLDAEEELSVDVSSLCHEILNPKVDLGFDPSRWRSFLFEFVKNKSGYIKFLESDPGVVDFRVDFIPIVYWDDDCVERVYNIDFYVDRGDCVEWVECIPHCDLRPIKKYLYARNCADSSGIVFRGLNDFELDSIQK